MSDDDKPTKAERRKTMSHITVHRYNQTDPVARALFQQLDSFRAQIEGFALSIAGAERAKINPLEGQRTLDALDAQIEQWRANIEASQASADNLRQTLLDMGYTPNE